MPGQGDAVIVATVTFEADGSYRCEIQAGEPGYPDQLDQVVSECVRLVRDVQAGLDPAPEEGDHAQG